jgi:putative transposase
MGVKLGHRIRLEPTRGQDEYFRRACGVARFAYNWALAEWRRQFATGGLPSEAALRRRLNGIKAESYPWMLEVTKCAPQQAIKHLGRAYENFFDDLRRYRRGELPWKRVRFPRFKRKGQHDRFRADNGPSDGTSHAVAVAGKRVKLPRCGWVRMREALRFEGRILSVVVSREADHWFASFTIEVAHEVPARTDGEIAGVDLGISALATIHDGKTTRKEPAPRPLRRLLGKLRRLSRTLTRKRQGSHNRVKAKTKLARLHARIANIRRDALHQLTTALVRRFRYLGIEDLSVRGMVQNRHLSRAISDLGWGEWCRQIEYKSAMYGSTVVTVDRWFPSSRLCSACGAVNEALTLAQQDWICTGCEAVHDRDENAAKNLRTAASSTAAACGAEGAGATLAVA